MTDLKDVNRRQTAIQGIPDYSGLTRISKTLDDQTSELRRSIQEVTESQQRKFSDAIEKSGIYAIEDTLNRAFAPTRELISNIIDASGLRISIAALQNIGNVTVKLKDINSVTESSADKGTKDASSCIVTMSADAEEKYTAGNITYKNTADIRIEAEIKDLKEGQRLILEQIASNKVDAADSIQAKITSIGFVSNDRSIIEINGKCIKFRGGIASIILHMFFGRKNFSKSRVYEVEDIFVRYDRNNNWFTAKKAEKTKFQNKVYQSVRNINNRFLEISNNNEKLIIQSTRNSYVINPKLFK